VLQSIGTQDDTKQRFFIKKNADKYMWNGKIYTDVKLLWQYNVWYS